MAKNRKNQSGVRFGPALKALLFCIFVGGAAVGYVWQKNQIDQLGRQIRAREVKLTELRHQNKTLRDQIATLHSPHQLKLRLAQLQLGLAMPQPQDVWRLPEPTVQPVAVPPSQTVRELAAR
jgi:cell division protein FtsB